MAEAAPSQSRLYNALHLLSRARKQAVSSAFCHRLLSYLGDEEPIGVQQATPSQLDRRLRDVVPEELREFVEESLSFSPNKRDFVCCQQPNAFLGRVE